MELNETPDFLDNISAVDNFMRTEIIEGDECLVSVGKASVIGGRKYQQDTISTDDTISYLECGKIIAVLCDGMGGLQGGEKASCVCAENLHREFYNNSDEIPVFFKKMVPVLDNAVHELKDESNKSLNAGTTLASVIISGNELYWLSVGDSHIYLYRQPDFKCITEEHNYRMLLNKKVEAGLITPEDVEKNPQKDALVSYIGMGGVKYVDMNVRPFILNNNDVVVICSDGLYRAINDAEIKDIISKNFDTQSIADNLINAAIGKNLKHQDNTSVIVMRYRE